MGTISAIRCVTSFFEDRKDHVFSPEEVFENIEKLFYYKDKLGERVDSFSLDVNYFLIEYICEYLATRYKINKIVINNKIFYHI